MLRYGVLADLARGIEMRGRLLLMAAIVAGLSYFISWRMDIGGSFEIAWKGAGVSLLALYAAAYARSVDGWLLVAVMAFGALGDVLLDAVALEAGAASFAVGHIFAIILYLRNRRVDLTLSQTILVLLTVPLGTFIAYSLVSPGEQLSIAVYALFVSAMAATAWISRFPRYRTGIGAMMFLASDLLIFAGMGPLSQQNWVHYAVWGLYFGGQVLIVMGVTGALYKDRLLEIDR
jgi:uncharacterized membrane protein YhhN